MPATCLPAIRACRPAWNIDRILGQERPLGPKHVRAIRVRFEIAKFELAFFNLPISSKPSACGFHSMRWTKVAETYRRTGNRRAVQLSPGQMNMDNTVRYPGAEFEETLALAEVVVIWPRQAGRFRSARSGPSPARLQLRRSSLGPDVRSVIRHGPTALSSQFVHGVQPFRSLLCPLSAKGPKGFCARWGP